MICSPSSLCAFGTQGNEMDWKLEIARKGNDTVVVVRGAREPYIGTSIVDAPTEFDLYTATMNNEDENVALDEALKQVKVRMKAEDTRMSNNKQIRSS